MRGIISLNITTGRIVNKTGAGVYGPRLAGRPEAVHSHEHRPYGQMEQLIK